MPITLDPTGKPILTPDPAPAAPAPAPAAAQMGGATMRGGFTVKPPLPTTAAFDESLADPKNLPFLRAVFKIESSSGQALVSKTSQARGPFQMVPKTWRGVATNNPKFKEAYQDLWDEAQRAYDSPVYKTKKAKGKARDRIIMEALVRDSDMATVAADLLVKEISTRNKGSQKHMAAEYLRGIGADPDDDSIENADANGTTVKEYVAKFLAAGGMDAVAPATTPTVDQQLASPVEAIKAALGKQSLSGQPQTLEEYVAREQAFVEGARPAGEPRMPQLPGMTSGQAPFQEQIRGVMEQPLSTPGAGTAQGEYQNSDATSAAGSMERLKAFPMGVARFLAPFGFDELTMLPADSLDRARGLENVRGQAEEAWQSGRLSDADYLGVKRMLNHAEEKSITQGREVGEKGVVGLGAEAALGELFPGGGLASRLEASAAAKVGRPIAEGPLKKIVKGAGSELAAVGREVAPGEAKALETGLQSAKEAVARQMDVPTFRRGLEKARGVPEKIGEGVEKVKGALDPARGLDENLANEFFKDRKLAEGPSGLADEADLTAPENQLDEVFRRLEDLEGKKSGKVLEGLPEEATEVPTRARAPEPEAAAPPGFPEREFKFNPDEPDITSELDFQRSVQKNREIQGRMQQQKLAKEGRLDAPELEAAAPPDSAATQIGPPPAGPELRKGGQFKDIPKDVRIRTKATPEEIEAGRALRKEAEKIPTDKVNSKAGTQGVPDKAADLRAADEFQADMERAGGRNASAEDKFVATRKMEARQFYNAAKQAGESMDDPAFTKWLTEAEVAAREDFAAAAAKGKKGPKGPLVPKQAGATPANVQAAVDAVKGLDKQTRKLIYMHKAPADLVSEVRELRGKKIQTKELLTETAGQLSKLQGAARKAIYDARVKGRNVSTVKDLQGVTVDVKGVKVPVERILQEQYDAIKQAGKSLVDHNVLSQKTFDKNIDTYMRRVYFRDLAKGRWQAPDQVFDRAVKELEISHMSGTTPLSPADAAIMARRDAQTLMEGGVPEWRNKGYQPQPGPSGSVHGRSAWLNSHPHVRRLMGEVDDGVFASIKTLGDVKMLNHNLDFFKKVSDNLPKWEASNPDKLRIKLPQNKLLGELSGKEVPQYVADALEDVLGAPNNAGEMANFLSSTFKAAKTVWSFTGHARQITGNTFNSVLAANNVLNPDNAPHYLNAMRSMWKKDALYVEAVTHDAIGGYSSREFSHMTNRLLDDALKFSGKKGVTIGDVINHIQRGMEKVRMPVEVSYDFWDNLYKLSTFSKARGASLSLTTRASKLMGTKVMRPGIHVNDWSRAQVLSPRDASTYVNKYFVNFSERAPALKAIQHPYLQPVVNPFLTVKYKSLGIWANAMQEHPARAGGLVATLLGSTALGFRAAGVDPDEIEQSMGDLQDTEKMPQRLNAQVVRPGKVGPDHKGPSVLGWGFQPVRDSEGNLQVADLTPHVPGGDVLASLASQSPTVGPMLRKAGSMKQLSTTESRGSQVASELIRMASENFLSGPLASGVTGRFKKEREEGKTLPRQIAEESYDVARPLFPGQIRNVTAAARGEGGSPLGSPPSVNRAALQNIGGIRVTPIDLEQMRREYTEYKFNKADLLKDQARVKGELRKELMKPTPDEATLEDLYKQLDFLGEKRLELGEQVLD